MSGVSRPATTHTAPSRVRAIARPRASQPRRTTQGRPFHISKVSRVSRIPCENTCSLAPFIAQSSAGRPGRLSEVGCGHAVEAEVADRGWNRTFRRDRDRCGCELALLLRCARPRPGVLARGGHRGAPGARPDRPLSRRRHRAAGRLRARLAGRSRDRRRHRCKRRRLGNPEAALEMGIPDRGDEGRRRRQRLHGRPWPGIRPPLRQSRRPRRARPDAGPGRCRGTATPGRSPSTGSTALPRSACVPCPPCTDGFHHMGLTEWRDLQAAARYAVAHGASRLVLVGYSMGGAIVAQFMQRSPLASRVAGLVLDAPALNWKRVLEFNATEMGLPGFTALPVEWAIGARIDADWDSLDALQYPEDFHLPILLFHGEDDKVVPISTSDDFAAELPRWVTYYRAPHAGHVEAWNVAPRLYERRLHAFLARALAIN